MKPVKLECVVNDNGDTADFYVNSEQVGFVVEGITKGDIVGPTGEKIPNKATTITVQGIPLIVKENVESVLEKLENAQIAPD